ncbi:MAG: ABC transporter ATP-binding protein [Oscillospiraceae bacterium]|nr:ABC transporter ATP-binding protein [Ruminococcus sp.]MDE6708175.1 ABC transporter ATP-binding protein [Oscillospiraceae bacterium]
MKLEIKNGCFGYSKQKIILNHIDFSAESGDLVAILGPNGAGKTTLLRCMLGFLKWHSGETLLNHKNLNQIPIKTLWKQIAYVPQAKNFNSASKAEEAILLGRNAHLGMFSQPKQSDLKLVHEIMEKLNILYLAKKSCSEMSGGELQMVLIARALIAEPKILILDEPESNLDFRNQLIILETMSSLTRQGMTCIFNTHYPDHALRRSNKALLLQKNGTCKFGKTSEIITTEKIQEAFHVKTIIHKIENQNQVYYSILPLELAESNQLSTGGNLC